MKFTFAKVIFKPDGGRFHFGRVIEAKSEPNAQTVFAIQLYRKCQAIGARYAFPFKSES